MFRTSVFAAFLAGVCGYSAHGQSFGPVNEYYVNKSFAGTPTNGTRDNPYVYLDDALADANGDGTQSNIYIAAGTYIPDEANSTGVNDTFTLDDNDHLVGGWDGADSTQPFVIDPDTYVVTLSGASTTYHVVTAPAASTGTQSIKGCTITLAVANGSGLGGYGGGVLNGDTIVIEDCIFDENYANIVGGAIYNGYGASTYIFGCTFTNNETEFAGGAVGNGSWDATDSGSGYVEIWDSDFSLNETGGDGGAVFCGESSDTTEAPNETVIIHCEFFTNTAKLNGGAVATALARFSGRMPVLAIYSSRIYENLQEHDGANGGGGVFIGGGWNSTGPTVYYAPEATIVNTSFCENSADGDGGGLLIGYGSGDWADGDLVDVHVTNCTFQANDAFDDGGGVLAQLDSVVLANTILWDNVAGDDFPQIGPVGGNPDPEVCYSDVEGGWTGTGAVSCIDEDPDFAFFDRCEVPITAAEVTDTALEAFIPLDVFDIDGDSNTTEPLPDLLLLTRVVNGGTALKPDMGAREIQP